MSSKRDQWLKAKKTRTFRNRLIALTAIAVIAVSVVLIYVFGGRGVSVIPAYANISASADGTVSSCTFSALWTDDRNISGYIFGSNCTGDFVNDTWVPFSDFRDPTSASSTIMKTVNSTIAKAVRWRVWCNNTDNHWNSIDLQTFILDSNRVLIRTSMGNITIELFDDTPITTSNFKNITRMGFYDNTIFHRVVADFVVQGGDPTGTGNGDPRISAIPDELPNRHSNIRGSVAMAKTKEPNSATSQFYVNLKDNSNTLDANYTVFGRVIVGMDVVDNIGNVPTDTTTQKPTVEVRLIKAELVG